MEELTLKCGAHSATVPREALSSGALAEIFSEDVWRNRLTEEDRKRLQRLLPDPAEPALAALFGGTPTHFTLRPLELLANRASAAAAEGQSVVDLIEHAAPRPRIPVDTLLKERNELLPLYHRTAAEEREKFDSRRTRTIGRVRKRYKRMLKEVRKEILGAGLSDVLYALSRQKRHRVAERMCFLEDATVGTAYTGRTSKRVHEGDIQQMLAERKKQRRERQESDYRHGLTESLYERAVASRQLPQPHTVVMNMSRGRAVDDFFVALQEIFKQCPGERAPASFVEECAGQWAARTGQPAPVMAALHYLSARTAKHAPCVERLASGDWHWIADSEELVRDRSRAWEEQEKPKPVPKNETRRLFQDEERQRYRHADEAFIYTTEDGSSAVVDPVRGVTAKNRARLQATKPRPNPLLVADRPEYVTAAALVLDALARLTTGRGSASHIARLLKDSQFVVPGTSEADLTGMVIKTLERLQAEPLPCVSFNPADNTCVYIDDRFQEEGLEPVQRLRLLDAQGQRPRVDASRARDDKGHRLGVAPPAGYKNVYGATRLEMSRLFDEANAAECLSDDSDIDWSSDEGASE